MLTAMDLRIGLFLTRLQMTTVVVLDGNSYARCGKCAQIPVGTGRLVAVPRGVARRSKIRYMHTQYVALGMPIGS
jgi:hypothetical protein